MELLSRLHYLCKPVVPLPVRLTLRRLRARWIMRTCGGIWPIDPVSATPPDGWPGWPEGKRFALVLTHDVESQRGLDRVKQLAELEMGLGFRSSFNFIPEGAYKVSPALLDWLRERGFEIGLHDLNHDGKLFWSQASFKRKAGRINRYLKEWRAVGFRSGFMLRNLDWIHDLDIAYDASTFDTDPFEPQPDGVRTIFPFWVPAPSSAEASSGAKNAGSSGYVELPYTLAQDSTLFVILQEAGIGIWQRKLDWIVQHGGMALLDTHPDYINFDGAVRLTGFPVVRYIEFLRHIHAKHAGAYWHVLPRELAGWVTTSVSVKAK